MFPIRRKPAALERLGEARDGESIENQSARRRLRPLSVSDRAMLTRAYTGGDLDAAAALIERRFPRLHISRTTADRTDASVALRIAPGAIALKVENGSHSPESALKYQRLADMAPFLNYAALNTKVSGAISLDLSDHGAPGKLSFSGRSPDLLIPDCHFMDTYAYERERHAYRAAPAWADRSPQVLWRGSTTGETAGAWTDLPRIALCRFGQKHAERLNLDFGVTSIVQVNAFEKVMIEHSGLLKPWVPTSANGHFRYHIDIDGNTNSWSGLVTKLLSGGLVIKVGSPSGWMQWFYPRLKAWEHFVPVAPDMGDLEEKLDWVFAHDKEAQSIAAEGRRFAESMTAETEATFGLRVIERRLSQGEGAAAAI